MSPDDAADAQPDDAHALLERFARGAADAGSFETWTSLRDAIKRRIVENTRAISVDAPLTLHRAAPLAEQLREERTGGEVSQAARELVADEHGITPADLHDFYPARTPPPSEGRWDLRLEGAALEQEQDAVLAALDEFDTAPPATMQRLAELVLQPTYATRSKYLAALQRLLSVSATLGAYTATAEEEQEEAHASWPAGAAAEAEAEPIFSPIPFLHGATATDNAPCSEQAAPEHDEQAVYHVPDGRVDELDTAEKQEAHGGVAEKVAPLSAATSLPAEAEASKRPRSDP